MSKAVRAGDVAQLVLFDREMDPKAGSAFEVTLSGYNVEEGVTGNGEPDNVASRKQGHISGTVSRPAEGDTLEFLQEKMNAFETGNCTITLVDGTVYGGDLSLTGESALSSDSGGIDFTVSGNVGKI